MPRLVYSLRLEPGGELVEFIVPFDPQGNSMAGGIKPIGKARIVDLRPGDSFTHNGASGFVPLNCCTTTAKNRSKTA
jgi:hypothetical protein